VTSGRMQRRTERLLDEADEVRARSGWAGVPQKAEDVLALNPGNQDATALLAAAERRATASPTAVSPEKGSGEPAATHPSSFVSGRYQVVRFPGEGGKKKVYLANGGLLARDYGLIPEEALTLEVAADYPRAQIAPEDAR